MGIFTVTSPAGVVTVLVPGAVALRRAGRGPLVRAGTDARGRLGVHQRLQQRAHQVTAVGALHHLGELEQGRLIQPCESFFREFLGGFSRSVTRWPPLNVRDRHGLVIQEPELHHCRGLSPGHG